MSHDAKMGGFKNALKMFLTLRFMFHFSRINILLLKSFYYCSTMAPIFISPKIESPITRACLRYAPWTVLIVARSVQSWICSLDISPGRERIFKWPIIRESVGTVQGAYRKNARVIRNSILRLINIGAIVEQ